MFLDFAQDQAERRKQVFLKDWKRKLDLFFDFNERKVLPPAMASSAARQRNNSGLGQYQLFEDRRRTGPLLRFLLMSSHEAHIRASPVKDKCSGDASGTDPEAASL